MPDKTNTLPEQIIEAGRSFTQTIEMENAVFRGQLNNAIEMTVNAMRELIVLCKDAAAIGNADTTPAQQNAANTAQQALADVKNAAAPAINIPAPAAPVTEAVLDSALLHAVAQSYDNAVTAQQQMYVTQQAATNQIIVTIITLITSTLGMAVKNAESGRN